MTEGLDLTGIEARLDTLIRLVALSVAPEEHSLKDRAVRLQRAGIAPKEIAVLCASTPNAVRVALSLAKSGRKRRKTARGARRS